MATTSEAKPTNWLETTLDGEVELHVLNRDGNITTTKLVRTDNIVGAIFHEGEAYTHADASHSYHERLARLGHDITAPHDTDETEYLYCRQCGEDMVGSPSTGFRCRTLTKEVK